MYSIRLVPMDFNLHCIILHATIIGYMMYCIKFERVNVHSNSLCSTVHYTVSQKPDASYSFK